MAKEVDPFSVGAYADAEDPWPAEYEMVPVELVEEIIEALDNYADAEYIDGRPHGNKAMNVLSSLMRWREGGDY